MGYYFHHFFFGQTTITRKSEFWTGVRDTIPFMLGTMPFGIVFGTIAENGGLTLWGALAFSAIVFAGSAQFIALSMITTGASIPLIILTTFSVNLRHLLYSATLIKHVRHLPQKWRIPLAFGLTDETFALLGRHYKNPSTSEFKHWYFLGSVLFFYSNWQLCTLMGIFFGRLIPGIQSWGLDFAMTVTFIGILVTCLKNSPVIISALVSGLMALMLHELPNKIGLIIAVLIGICSGCLAENWQKKFSQGGPSVGKNIK